MNLPYATNLQSFLIAILLVRSDSTDLQLTPCIV
ncbi:MAG: hypothetical protein RLZZ139_1068 [Cyanobacteriota bacterium]|jgi:hypothetical protein